MKSRKNLSDLELNCAFCNSIFFILKKEYKRQIRKGRQNFFCSRSCSANFLNKERGGNLIFGLIISCPACDVKFAPKTSDQKFCSIACSNSIRIYSNETRAKMSCKIKQWIKNNPEKDARIRQKQQETIDKGGMRFSSKAERNLAQELFLLGFRRHKFIRSGLELNFDVDCWIQDERGNIWVESDGPYHFRKVHKNHNFEKTKRRDEIEEIYVLDKPILLLRVDNEKYSIHEQIDFVKREMLAWDGSPQTKKFY